jgi:hypothetical protein
VEIWSRTKREAPNVAGDVPAGHTFRAHSRHISSNSNAVIAMRTTTECVEF